MTTLDRSLDALVDGLRALPEEEPRDEWLTRLHNALERPSAPRRRRLVPALAFAGAAGATLALVLPSGGEHGASALARVRAASAAAQDAGSVHYRTVFRRSGRTTGLEAGAIDFRHHAMLTRTRTQDGIDEQRMIGRTAYFRYRGHDYHERWTGVRLPFSIGDAEYSTAVDPTLLSDPLGRLRALNGTSAGVAKVGGERIGSVATTHYRARATFPFATAVVTADGHRYPITDAGRAGVGTPGTVDVWLDAAGRPVRTTYALDFGAVPGYRLPKSLASMRLTTAHFPVTITTDFTRYGGDVSIARPQTTATKAKGAKPKPASMRLALLLTKALGKPLPGQP
jgi:hypothetical protein